MGEHGSEPLGIQSQHEPRSKKEASLSSVGSNALGICGCPNIVLQNGIKLDAGRGEQNISASIPVRLILTTAMSSMVRLCRSTTKLQRKEICLLRLRNLFSFDKATAA